LQLLDILIVAACASDNIATGRRTNNPNIVFFFNAFCLISFTEAPRKVIIWLMSDEVFTVNIIPGTGADKDDQAY